MVLFYLSIVVLMYAIYVYSKRKYNYWTQNGVKGPVPLPIVGNFGKLLVSKQSHFDLMLEWYEQYSNEKAVGLYRGWQPVLLLRDPELIKRVLIQDFPIFQDRGTITFPGLKKLGKNLIWANGVTWKVLRSKLTPLFSTKKIKDMVPLVEDCVNNYSNYVEYLTDNSIEHEIRSLKLKYILQVIGSCNFGIYVDTFSDKEEEFSVMASKMFQPSKLTIALYILDNLIPGVTKFDTTDLLSFFQNLVSQVIQERENKPMKRKDFMDLMIELKAQGKVNGKSEHGESEIEIDDEIIAAQALVFYAAAFETSSSAMSFMVHELALHQDIQDKAYEEICRVTAKYDGKITYEAIREMNYLEMVYHETLRKHTVVQLIKRKAIADYTLPGLSVPIPKDTLLYISVSGLHHDKNYYENPEKFDPEHFSPESKINRPNCTYLAFGEGPRNCIGIRFALIQSLMGMAAFLKKFRVEPSAKTRAVLEHKITLITSESKDGVWVKISKR